LIIQQFGITPEGDIINEFTLSNRRGMEMKVMNYGCTITSLKVPDREGLSENIVLGHNHLEGYLNSCHYIGSVVGRCANRIANGRFLLDGKEHYLGINSPPHHLHGGIRGFDKMVWSATPFENEMGEGIDFHYFSKENEEGYPGNLNVYIRYLLGIENDIIIVYLAETDHPTIINLTQHSYFNLSGGKENILNHDLMIHAHHFLPVDNTMIPTGEIRHVNDTPFDFRSIKPIGRDIGSRDDQLLIAGGYDHNWVLTKEGEELSHAATLIDPFSGRILDIHTTEPGLQLYTSNTHIRGINNTPYPVHSWLCLETQHFPDSPNHPGFPSVRLEPVNQFRSTTILKFSTM
jgi:aldose 1-epimerase